MMHWVQTVLKKYAVFGGRAQRAEYWYFMLFYVVAYVVLGLLDGSLTRPPEESGTGLLTGVFALALLIPSLAVSVRRLHDTDRSGWWLLLILVPLIGAIVLLVFTIQDGTQGDNRFGPDPKQQVALPGPPGAT